MRDLRSTLGGVRDVAHAVAARAWTRLLRARERRRARRVRARPQVVLARLRDARTILFVCHANAIRSVFAARWLTRALGEDPPVAVGSGGLGAVAGWRAHRHAITAAARRGLDLRDHRAVGLTAETVGAADVIFVMEAAHLVSMRRRFPDARPKTFLLTCLAPEVTLEIRDPWDEPEVVVHGCFDQIVAALEPIARAVLRPKVEDRARVTRSKTGPSVAPAPRGPRW
jgi:protein-tyrosine phosphatase